MSTTEHQKKIHPVDVEAPPPTAPLFPRGHSRSDKPDDTYPPFRRTIPLSQSRAPLPPPRRSSHPCRRCLCCTLCTLILLVIAVAAAAAALYLTLSPKAPSYSVDRLRVTDFSVDPSSLTARATFDVTVSARNPNKHISIHYLPGSRLSVYYDDTALCAGALPEFEQGHRNSTVLTVVLNGESQLGGGIYSVLQQQQQTGSVPLRFRGDVPVKVKLGVLRLWKMTFGVRCDLVVESLSTTSSFISIKTSSCKLKKVKLF